MNRVVANAIFIVSLSATTVAAFPTGDQFDLDALTEDGGGGRSFAGGPADSGLTCDVCHTGAPGRIGLRLEADDPNLFSNGYVPDRHYRLRVVLENQWAALDQASLGSNCGGAVSPYQRCDENGFALEIANAWGGISGVLEEANASCGAAESGNPDVRVMDNHAAVTHTGLRAGQTAWSLCWTAPPEGNGVVTAYLAAVDGGGGDGTPNNPEDMTGDDVVVGSVALRERGGRTREVDGGCSATGHPTESYAVLLIALLFLAVRRVRPRTALLIGTLTLGASACASVKPHEKQELARRKMVFSPDAAEDELDLHMQQSREGSAGGYGNAGGGCGCN